MNTILQITEGRGSRSWTDDDLVHLKTDLEQRRSQAASDFAAGAGDQTDLPGEKGMGPDPVAKAQGF